MIDRQEIGSRMFYDLVDSGAFYHHAGDFLDVRPGVDLRYIEPSGFSMRITSLQAMVILSGVATEFDALSSREVWIRRVG